MAKKFEYKTFRPHELEDHNGQVNEKFVQLGLEGWELVGSINGEGGGRKLYFKREIESPLTHKQERNYDGISR
jgi:hypothetical protein